MKKKLIPVLLILPLLTSCSGGKAVDHVPADYTPDLPQFKDKGSGAVKQDDTYAYFDIYEVSDFHGATVYNKEEKELGIERLSSYFDAKREDNPGGTILISSGDMWQGSADSNVTRGNLVTYAMDVMNFSAMTFGNHEFDWEAGETSWIQNNKDRATFPFLGANIFKKGTTDHPEYCQASTVVERGGFKVGIVGTIGDNIRDSILAAAIADLEFTDEVVAAKSEAAKLRSEGCDIVVWSTHNDVESIQTRVSTVPDLGVDAIFGGHSHANITKESVTGAPMLETKNYGRGIAHASIKINKSTKEIVSATGNVDADPTYQDYSPDKDITGIYDQYSKKYINAVKNRKLGKADAKFSKEDELGNLAVYSMNKAASAKYNEIEISAAFTNKSGGVRADLEKGKIIYGDVYAAFPFDNEIVIMKTSGKNLKSYLSSTKLNAARYNNVYDKTIDSSKDYYYLTTDYLATNASFPFMENGDPVIEYTKLNVRDVIADTILEMGKIKAQDFKTSANKQYQRIK